MTTHFLLPLFSLLLVVLATPAAAFHTVFDFTVDRFAVDGNALGSFDGTPDWVDDFPGTSTQWVTAFGTSSVSGGRLHVQSPGVHFPGPDGTSLDLTEVASPRLVFRDMGSFTATAVFDPIIPPDGHFYHFTLFTFGSQQFFSENFGLDIHTLNGETRIEQHLVVLDIASGVYQTVQTASQVVDPADVTGQIHFRLSYDDATDGIVGAFSLDGGQTFQAPFAPAPIFTAGRTSGQFLLGADPHVSTDGSTTTTTTSTTTTTLPFGQCLRTDCLSAPRGTFTYRDRTGRLAWTWRNGAAAAPDALGDPTRPDGTRYALCVRDATGLVWSAVVEPGDGWRILSGPGVAYRGDRKAAGVQALKVGVGRRPRIQATAGGAGIDVPMTLPITVGLEAEGGGCWTSTFDAAVRNGNGQVRAKR